ncbi:hypothetical protein Tco_0238534 [Tanacetum coccineum]
MFYRENVDYPELIWENFAFQIDHKKERKSRRETIPFPRFTKVIINHFLSQHKSLSNLKYQHYHTIKDDGIVSRLKFVRIGEDFQEYGLAIPDMMRSNNLNLTRCSSSTQLVKFLPRRAEAKSTTSRRVVKRKVIIFAADNIIPDPDVALELGKSISLTEAEEEEAARQVHATHAKIPKPASSKLKLEGVQSLTPEEQEVADVIQALKEIKKTNKRQLDTGGSTEGTGRILAVPNESTVVSATSSEGTESEYSEEDQGDDEEVDWIDSNEDEEKKDDYDNDKSIDLEMTDDEETDDEVLQGKEQVNDDEDEDMSNVVLGLKAS